MTETCDLCHCDTFGMNLELKLSDDRWGDFLRHCGVNKEVEEGEKWIFFFCTSCLAIHSDQVEDWDRAMDLLKRVIGVSTPLFH